MAILFMGTAGLVAFGFTLIFNNIQHLAIIVLVGLLTLGAIGCWLIIGFLGWRWFRNQNQHPTAPGYMPQQIPTNSPVAPLINVAPVRANWQVPPSYQAQLVPAVNLTPAEFEQEVAWVLGHRFGLQAEVIGKTNDGGIDVNLYDAAGVRVAIVQAKRYDTSKALNPGFLRELDSCKRRMNVPNAYLVTTAHFSLSVSQQAQQMGIYLIDGQLFESWRQSVYAVYPR